jgi:hypothetical protein
LPHWIANGGKIMQTVEFGLALIGAASVAFTIIVVLAVSYGLLIDAMRARRRASVARDSGTP